MEADQMLDARSLLAELAPNHAVTPERIDLFAELLLTAAQLDLEHLARLSGDARGQLTWQMAKAGLAPIDPEHPGIAALDLAGGIMTGLISCGSDYHRASAPRHEVSD